MVKRVFLLFVFCFFLVGFVSSIENVQCPTATTLLTNCAYDNQYDCEMAVDNCMWNSFSGGSCYSYFIEECLKVDCSNDYYNCDFIEGEVICKECFVDEYEFCAEGSICDLVCISNCSCAKNTLFYFTCPDGCGGYCSGEEYLGLYYFDINITSPQNNINVTNPNNFVINYTVAFPNAYASINCTLIQQPFHSPSFLNQQVNLDIYEGNGSFVTNLSNGSSVTSYYVYCNYFGNEAVSQPYNVYFNTSIVNDLTAPIVSLNYPSNLSYINSTNSISFKYNVTEITSQISNCSLILNGENVFVSKRIFNGTENLFNVSGLSNGNYSWNVSCYDNSINSNFGTSQTFYFTLDYDSGKITPEENQSKIVNYGSKWFSFYFYMFVEYWNTSISEWQFIDVVVDDTLTNTKRTLITGQTIGLDTIWNPNAWDSENYSAGDYRAVVSVVDPNKNVLKDTLGVDLITNYEFCLIPSNTEPVINSISLVSDNLENKTNSILNCKINLSDYQEDEMSGYVYWYKNGTLNSTIFIPSLYSGIYVENLSSSSTSKHEVWSCSAIFFDGSLNSTLESSSNLTILNSPPVVSLYNPSDGATLTNRTPKFFWNGTDNDLDNLIYDLEIELVPSSLCYEENRNYDSISSQKYLLTSELKCLYDDFDYYKWRVRAYDGEEYSSWTSYYDLKISSLIILELIESIVSFDTSGIENILNLDENTSDNSPTPFVLRNKGNVPVNVKYNASSLWVQEPNESIYYQTKAREYSGQSGAFDWISSFSNWVSMPITAAVVGVGNLDYHQNNNTVKVDVAIKTPPAEIPGVKSSYVIFTSSMISSGCGNGICEIGENCSNCVLDCYSLTGSPACDEGLTCYSDGGCA